MKSSPTQFQSDPHPAGVDRRYHFDVTDIADFVRTTATLSGIQRVAFTVIKEMAISHGSDRVFLCMRDRRSGKYVSIATDRLMQTNDFGSAAVRYALGMTRSAGLDSAPTLEKYEGRPAKQTFHRLIGSLRAVQRDESYFRRRGTSLDEWKAHWQTAKSGQIDGPMPSLPFEKRECSTIMRPGDELVLLGALWDRNDLHDTFQSIKANGVSITLMIYDLIPLTVPEASPDTHNRFLEWLQRAVGYADRFLCISQNTANDLSRFLGECEQTKPVTVVALAQQFTSPSDVPHERLELSTRARISEVTALSSSVLAITTRPFVLCVGTMEVRKNNLGLSQAWAYLARDPDLDLPRLVFAGKKGWNNEPFFEFLEASGNLGGWVQVVEGPSDKELEYLYRHCEFTALVSFAEGWGLPIGESLSYGKTAVVANNTSMPEVGGDMVEYCDARSVQSIAMACRKLIGESDRRRELEDRIKATRLRSWDDVLQDFVDAVEGNTPVMNND